jgi:hypothetical protein
MSVESHLHHRRASPLPSLLYDAAAMLVTPAFAESSDEVEQARTLISTLNLFLCNLPLPPAVLRVVSGADLGVGRVGHDPP